MNPTVLIPLLGIQVATFVVLGICFCLIDQWRLGIAQLLLAAVQVVVYTGQMK